MPHTATDRVSRGLRWAGGVLFAGGMALVVVGIAFTRTADALVTAAVVAVLACGLPGAAAFGLAMWLEHEADRIERREERPDPNAGGRHPFREPVRLYAIAVVAVAGAWGARVLLDQIAPRQVPFLTYFLAVIVAGWFGGFGPAALATLLSLVITWFVYMPGLFFGSAGEVGQFVILGLFVMVCLGIAAITAALHAALERTHVLAQELARLRAGAPRGESSGTPAPAAGPAASVGTDTAMGVVPIRRESPPPQQ